MISDNTVVDAIAFILILIPSVMVHEVSHGLVARRLGDTTAQEAGRLTFNPIRHIDPFGSVLLPGMLALAGRNVFGWAKPVPVNPSQFRSDPVRGMALTALAGPASNLAIVFVVGRFHPFIEFPGFLALADGGVFNRILASLLLVNAALAIFNMLPIPPLDGSRLLPLVLPPAGRRLYTRIAPFGFFILFGLLFIIPGSLRFLYSWIIWLVRLAV
jgi:Zn-dependent protease